MLAVSDQEFGDATRNGGVNVGLHFHGFEGEELCAALDSLIGLNSHAGDYACSGRADLARLGGVGFGMGALDDAEGAIADIDLTRLAI